jgi:hypothetical protein
MGKVLLIKRLMTFDEMIKMGHEELGVVLA